MTTKTKKLDRTTDNLLKLNRIELYYYPILFSHKLNLNRYGSTVFVAAGDLSAHASCSAENKAAEKMTFNVKLEKFEAASKIKVNKEIRAFMELGLKGAKGDEIPRCTTILAVFEQRPTFKSSRKCLTKGVF
ncbi:hypothetical protein N665_0100s0022 [Sinapis alba]|nr:hypothetical protein N665_0100s0022 [Sinapis alba]